MNELSGVFAVERTNNFDVTGHSRDLAPWGVFGYCLVIAEDIGVWWDAACRLKVYGPERIEAPPVGEVSHRVPYGVLQDVVYLAHEDLECPVLLLLGDYQSSRLPARTRANAMGTKSIPMKRVTVQSEERPRAMGL